MLTQVDAITGQGNVLALFLNDGSEGYVVKEIEGLDPVKATLVSSSFANVDGEQYYSSRREARNIIIKLGLEPNHNTGTGRQLRSNLYKYFMPKSSLTLRFYEEELGGYVDIEGVVESLHCPPFAQELEATISIMCHNPDFIEPNARLVDAIGAASSEEILIDYDGTIETGYVFRLTSTSDAVIPDFTIYQHSPDNVLSVLEFTEPIAVGAAVEISTITGSKYARYIDPVTESSESILYGIDPQSPWPELYPGENRIQIVSDNPEFDVWIEYIPRHGGL